MDREHLIEGLRHRFADHEGPVLFLSARTKEGMDSLREVLYAEVRELHAAFPAQPLPLLTWQAFDRNASARASAN